MRLTPGVKAIVALFLVLGTVGYALLLEFAVNAGRVHRGVRVEGFDVGGLNYAEAVEELEARGDELKVAPMIFTTEGFDCRFTPEDVGWGPQPAETADAAIEVGRSGGIADVLGDRLDAWTDGVNVEWAGKPDPARVGRELNRCEETAAGLGVDIDRPRLRFKIKRAIVTWPRRPVRIPVEG
ncbi:MAG TPA: hypothetical protein VJ927_04670 [Actinomycetota bacterium]|nr:hypothetical protein [Actinomycetota bacterium]